jgi:hypothetical protein
MTRWIAMDIGWRIAYKRAVPQRGHVNGGIKSHGEETQEGKENLSEKDSQATFRKGLAKARGLPSHPRPLNRSRELGRAAAKRRAALFSTDENPEKTHSFHQSSFLPVPAANPPICHSPFWSVCEREDPAQPEGDRIYGPTDKQAGSAETRPKDVATGTQKAYLSRAAQPQLDAGWRHRRERRPVHQPFVRPEFKAAADARTYTAFQPAHDSQGRRADLGLPLFEEVRVCFLPLWRTELPRNDQSSLRQCETALGRRKTDIHENLEGIPAGHRAPTGPTIA